MTTFHVGSIVSMTDDEAAEFRSQRTSIYEGVFALAAQMQPGQWLPISNDGSDPALTNAILRRRIAAGLKKFPLPVDRSYSVRLKRSAKDGQQTVFIVCTELSEETEDATA